MILTKENIEEIDLDFLIDKKIKQNLLNTVLFIVPTNRKSRYLKRELISLSPNQSVSGLNIETIESFSLKIYSSSISNSKLLSDEAAIVLLNHCFQETSLNYFSQYRDGIPFGTLERVRNVISEYKRHGITPRKLLEETDQLSGAEKIKAQDIANVYRAFQKRIGDIGLFEIGDVYNELIQFGNVEFERKFIDNYPDVDLVLINGFDEFTQPEVDILNLAADLKKLTLYLKLDYYRYNPLIFSHLDSCHRKFIEAGFREIKDISPSAEQDFLNEVRKNFSLSISSGKNKLHKNDLVVISAENREKEVELISKEIKEIISRDKVDPSKICVTFNLIGKYSPLIRDRFKLYGLPYNLTDRFLLNTSPPVVVLINFLEILENDFYYKNIFRSLNSNFLQDCNVNLSNLLKVSVNLKIVSGLENWRSRLNDSITESTIGGAGSIDELHRLESYRQALSDVNTLYNYLEPFDLKMSPVEFHNSLLSFIQQMNIPSKILNAEGQIVEKDSRAFTTFLSSLSELINILELEYPGNKKFPLKFYLKQLKTLTSFARYNIKEKPGFGVQVTTLNELRGLQFDYLFIAGLNDNDLPTRFTPEIFLSGSFARKERRHQIEERYHFYQTLCAWKKKLYLTFPLSDDRKELVKSNLLKDFENQFEVSYKNYSDYQDGVYSKEELYEFLGSHSIAELEKISIPNSELDLQKIKNAIQTDKLRLSDPFGKSGFTGNLPEKLPTQVRNELDEVHKKQFSISQLETYAKCPYKYLAERILDIKSIEEPAEELEAFEFGSLIHTILYEFYVALGKMGIKPQGCTDEEFKKAESLMFKIANEKFEELKLKSEQTFYEKEKFLGINQNRKNSILFKFLEEERNADDGYYPSFFEFEFGNFNNSVHQSSNTFEIDGIKIRGKIDRVDINEKEQTIKVIDYKLGGSKPTVQELINGVSIQLPVYLYVAKELIKSQLNKDHKPAGSEIYSLKYSEKDFGKKQVGTGSSRSKDIEKQIELAEDMIDISRKAIVKYVKSISEGKFHLSTLNDRENKVCRYCNFRLICRIQDLD